MGLLNELKKGRYGIYKGKEYKLFKNEDGSNNLISKNFQDKLNGFTEKYPNTLVKTVENSELDRVIQIDPIAIYKNERFDVVRLMDHNKLVIGTSNVDLAESMHFNRTDKYYYEKGVLSNDVEIIEQHKDVRM